MQKTGVLEEGSSCFARIVGGPAGGMAGLQLTLKLLPLKICEYVHGLDGRFRPFALIPPGGEGPGDWEAVDLAWKGTDGPASEWAVYGAERPLTKDQLRRAQRE